MRVASNNEFDHAPSDIVDYGFDYSGQLAVGETISSSTWAATTGITLSGEAIVGEVTSVVASGGVRGEIYYLTNTVITSAGKKYHRVIVLSCKQL